MSIQQPQNAKEKPMTDRITSEAWTGWLPVVPEPRPEFTCFICEKPAPHEIIGTVHACDDHVNGTGGNKHV